MHILLVFVYIRLFYEVNCCGLLHIQRRHPVMTIERPTHQPREPELSELGRITLNALAGTADAMMWGLRRWIERRKKEIRG